MRGLIDGLRTGAVLTQRRLLIAATVLLVIEIALFAITIATSHGAFGPEPKPSTVDFMSFYAAGRLAQAGTPALTYDHAVHHAMEQATAGAQVPYIYFYYPPVYLLLCVLFPLLPYVVSFVAFQAATLLFYLGVLRRILTETRWLALLPLIAFTPAFWNMGEGQNGFLTAALFGAATLTVERRPLLAGMLFGLICYKPHFGLLIPVALVASGNWRAVFAAGATVAALCGLSVLLFGIETWHAYLIAMAGSDAVYVTGTLAFTAFLSPFGTARALGLAPPVAYAAQAVATAAMIGLVAYIWWRRPSLPARAAVLAAATPIAIPVVLIYDLLLTGVAMAWLVRLGRAQGFPPWHKLALTLLFIWPLFALNLESHVYILAPPTTAMGVLVLAVLTARRELTPKRDDALSMGSAARA